MLNNFNNLFFQIDDKNIQQLKKNDLIARSCGKPLFDVWYVCDALHQVVEQRQLVEELRHGSHIFHHVDEAEHGQVGPGERVAHQELASSQREHLLEVTKILDQSGQVFGNFGLFVLGRCTIDLCAGSHRVGDDVHDLVGECSLEAVEPSQPEL